MYVCIVYKVYWNTTTTSGVRAMAPPIHTMGTPIWLLIVHPLLWCHPLGPPDEGWGPPKIKTQLRHWVTTHSSVAEWVFVFERCVIKVDF